MNLCIVCLDALRVDHVIPEIMPNLCALLDKGRRYTNVRTKTAWTPTSVAAMLLGHDDAFELGPSGTVGMPSIAGRLHGTHATAAFLGQATLATEDCLWIFRDFDHVWSIIGEGDPWRTCDMDEVWTQFLGWHQDPCGDNPWFAYVHLFEVHEPYAPQATDDTKLEWVDKSLSKDALGHLNIGRFSPLMDLATGRLDVTDTTADYLRKRYKVYCRMTDQRLAEVWPKLLDGDTLLAIVSDHGDSHGEDGVWGHGRPAVYQTEAARRTLLGVVGPGIEPEQYTGERSNQAVANIATGLLVGRSDGDTVATERKLRELGYLG